MVSRSNVPYKLHKPDPVRKSLTLVAGMKYQLTLTADCTKTGAPHPCPTRTFAPSFRWSPFYFVPASLAAFLFLGPRTAQASIAYGSINSFDSGKDTSNVCHGFEIELDDIHRADITYAYDHDDYGTPKISEDTKRVPRHV
jgi:hypothetical protein